jgi:hypothetical protein
MKGRTAIPNGQAGKVTALYQTGKQCSIKTTTHPVFTQEKKGIIGTIWIEQEDNSFEGPKTFG